MKHLKLGSGGPLDFLYLLFEQRKPYTSAFFFFRLSRPREKNRQYMNLNLGDAITISKSETINAIASTN